MEAAVQAITDGVPHLPMKGIPGNILLLSAAAVPLYVGSSNGVLAAISTCGKGRVVAFSHTGYLNTFRKADCEEDKTFKNNLLAWLSGEKKEVYEVKEVMKKVDIKPGAVLLATEKLRQGTINKVIKFVEEGGGLIMGCTPWGWQQVSRNLSLDEMSLSPIMIKCGMIYTGQYLQKAKSGKIDAVTPETINEFHFHNAILGVTADVKLAASFGSFIGEGLREITDEAYKLVQKPTEDLWASLKDMMDDVAPMLRKPTKSQRELGIVKMVAGIMKTVTPIVKAPAVSNFPGDFSQKPALQCTELKVTSLWKDFHATGYYVPAGETLEVEVLDGEASQWVVRIGAHMDQLFNHKKLMRWPDIYIQKQMSRKMKIGTSFGGQIYLSSPSGKAELHLRLGNVVESPYFNINDPNASEQWKHRRQDPGLWADIVGRFMTITLPSASIRELEDPKEAIEFYDRLVATQHSLRATDVLTAQRQWLVPDMQPSNGYMHSGYPIITNLDITNPKAEIFLLNATLMKKNGSWGIFHEIGHNMQRPEWTPKGTVETTCNIFSLYCMETLISKDRWLGESGRLQTYLPNVKRYLEGGAKFEKWQQSPGVALVIYGQLAYHFGWGSYQKVFGVYEQKLERPKSNDDKIKLWIKNFSLAVTVDLRPLFKFWGFPFCDKNEDAYFKELDSLVPFLPDDEITSMAPERTESIVDEHVVRKAPKYFEPTACPDPMPAAPCPDVVVVGGRSSKSEEGTKLLPGEWSLADICALLMKDINADQECPHEQGTVEIVWEQEEQEQEAEADDAEEDDSEEE